MALYLRKSIKVGPLRFNLSRSGIGISGGVTGLRVGAGPRGNYVHMGRQGLYYRATLPSSERGNRAAVAGRLPASPSLPPRGIDGLTEIESGSVEAMTHSSSTELLEEVRSKRRRVRYWPVTLVVGSIVWLALLAAAPLWVSLASLIALLALSIWLARRDVLRKTVVLMYELDQTAEAAYQAFHNGFDWLVQSRRAWHLEAKGDVGDRKKHAGATSLIRRRAICPVKADPPDLKTNLAIPMLPVGRQRLYFLPDRVLVFEGASVGAVGYEQLTVEVTGSRFIEEEAVPEDAEVVGSTWRYVNKKGGPDRRFKDNRQLPILLYGQIHFESPTGLNEMVQVSNAKAAEHFAAGVQALATALAAIPSHTDAGAKRREGHIA